MERLERLAREMEGSSRDLRLKSIIMGGGGDCVYNKLIDRM